MTAPGTGMDSMARHLAESFTRRWGQPVVVDDRPGADGIIAVEALMAARDGHSLFYGSLSVATLLRLMHPRLAFDPVQELLPISLVVEDFIAAAAPASLGVDSLAGLLALARSRPPGALNYATAPGSPYLATRDFLHRAQVEMSFVPYRTSALAIPDMLAGRIHFLVAPISSFQGQAAAAEGGARLLAIAGTHRAPGAPDAPTAAEAGHPELAIPAGNALYGPRDMPAVRRAEVAEAVRLALAEPETARRVARLGYVARGSGPEELAAMLDAARTRWGELARPYGAQPPQ
jgi:tripartite-type tricarboxylate transporter receptor subunit TctC